MPSIQDLYKRFPPIAALKQAISRGGNAMEKLSNLPGNQRVKRFFEPTEQVRTRDFIRELPGAAKTIAKTFYQEPARYTTSLLQRPVLGQDVFTPQTKFEKFFLRDEPIKSAETSYFAQKARERGVSEGKAANIGRFAVVGGLLADVSGAGRAKGAAKAFALANDAKMVEKVAAKAKIKLTPELTDFLVREKNPEKIATTLAEYLTTKGVKAIPKEFEPLAEEARKYPSAEEFVKALLRQEEELLSKPLTRQEAAYLRKDLESPGYKPKIKAGMIPNPALQVYMSQRGGIREFQPESDLRRLGMTAVDFYNQATGAKVGKVLPPSNIQQAKAIPKELEPLAKEARIAKIDSAGRKIIEEKNGIKIAVNDIKNPSYVTLWDGEKKIGELRTSNKAIYGADDYIQIGSVEIDKKYRNQGLATELYKTLIKYAPEGKKGIVGYYPDIVAKKAISRIYEKLGGRLDKETGNYYIDFYNQATGAKVGKTGAKVGKVLPPSNIQQAKASGMSFDEWVKGQGERRVLHGTDIDFEIPQIKEGTVAGERGFFTTTSRTEAGQFGKKIKEFFVAPNAKVKTIDASSFESLKPTQAERDTFLKEGRNAKDMLLTKRIFEARRAGFDAIEIKNADITGKDFAKFTETKRKLQSEVAELKNNIKPVEEKLFSGKITTEQFEANPLVQKLRQAQKELNPTQTIFFNKDAIKTRSQLKAEWDAVKVTPKVKPEIPPELEPLAKEARKYKSAEEFANERMKKMTAKSLFNVGDVVDTGGGNLQTIIGIEGNGVRFRDSKGVEYAPFSKSTLKNILTDPENVGTSWRFVRSQTKAQLIDLYNQATGAKVGKVLPPSQVGKPPTSAKAVVPEGIPPSVGTPKSIPKVKAPLVQPSPTIVAQDPVQKVISALKEAKPIRKGQEVLYSQERGKRLGRAIAVGERVPGEKGFYAQLGQLKGELPKVEYESIRSKISQQDIDSMFTKLRDTPLLSEFDKISAQTGLAKIFGDVGGQVPTEGEIKLLSKAFGPDFAKAIQDKLPLLDKIKKAGLEIANIPRSLMASFDVSAPFRQGLFLSARYPKQFFGAFVDMFRAFGSEKASKALQESIVSRPTFEAMRDSKLALMDLDNVLTAREEQFMSSWAEKIPVIGKGVRASARAYTGFLNKLRADVFDHLYKQADSLGLDPAKNPGLLQDLSKFINSASGRGNLGPLERSAVALNSIFFSPRLMASRLNLLNPVYYVGLDPFVRKQALQSFFALGAAATTVFGLAKMAGAEVGADPRSADFGKIKVGNTRVDILGGFQQYIRLASQLVTGKLISSTTGKEYTLGEGYKPITRQDILIRFFQSKENPIVSLFTDLLRGTDFAGEPFDIKSALAQRFIPMVAQDAYDLYKDKGATAVPVSFLALFGFGVQTYGPTEKEKAGVTQTKKGFQVIIDGQKKYFDTQDKAQLEVAKDAFKKSNKNFQEFGDYVLRRNEDGSIKTQRKTAYEIEKGKATLTNLKSKKDVKGWLEAAKKQAQRIIKEMEADYTDEVERLKLENQLRILMNQYEKYSSYGGFTKPKKGRKLSGVRTTVNRPSFAKSKAIRAKVKAPKFASISPSKRAAVAFRSPVRKPSASRRAMGGGRSRIRIMGRAKGLV